MARVKLALPDAFRFQTDMTLRVGDMNYGGHLGNDAVLALLHEARVRFLRQLGGAELDFGGVGIIMTDAVVVYRSQGRLGETVRIQIEPQELHEHGFDLLYQVCEARTGREIARAKTGFVGFDYSAGKIARLSGFARERLAAGALRGRGPDCDAVTITPSPHGP
jgi:4-hydroxybenzoyl-CoA thioesterase